MNVSLLPNPLKLTKICQVLRNELLQKRKQKRELKSL